jgi:hypothetical protein
MSIAANWGATAEERAMTLACDQLLPRAPVRLHRAVTVTAPAAIVFRWLCQLKLAPYSYDLLDNLGRRSPRELTPGAEMLEEGQRFMSIFALACFAHDRHITLRSRRTAVSYATIERDGETRLLARVLFEPPGVGLQASLTGRALALGDLVMMRKQLLSIGALAERDADRARPPESSGTAPL